MKKIKLKKLVSFVPGMNPTRAEKKFGNIILDYYDQATFEQDFYRQQSKNVNYLVPNTATNLTIKTGDVVISNYLQRATITSTISENKMLSLNFIKVVFLSDQLDPSYFVYLFNENKNIKKQKDKSIQGSTTILKIPIKYLEEITILLPSIEDQKSIGEIYLESLRLKGNLNRYGELLEQLASSVLENHLKGEAHEK